MKRMVSHLSAALALGLAAGSAQADVVYNWQQAQPTAEVARSFGQLRVTDEAYLAGAVSYTIRNNLGGSIVGGDAASVVACSFGPGLPPCSDPNAPVLGFNFAVQAPGPRGTVAGLGFSPTFDVPNLAAATFVLTLGEQLSGRIEAGEFSRADEVHLFGSASSWAARFVTDNTVAGCNNSVTEGCRFAGLWVLDRSSVPNGIDGQVPEPGSLPLMALASLGMAAALRRKSASAAA